MLKTACSRPGLFLRRIAGRGRALPEPSAAARAAARAQAAGIEVRHLPGEARRRRRPGADPDRCSGRLLAAAARPLHGHDRPRQAGRGAEEGYAGRPAEDHRPRRPAGHDHRAGRPARGALRRGPGRAAGQAVCRAGGVAHRECRGSERHDRHRGARRHRHPRPQVQGGADHPPQQRHLAAGLAHGGDDVPVAAGLRRRRRVERAGRA